LERTAEITWEGNLARGTGLISAASSGAFQDLSYTLATRMGEPEGHTSPEELFAAAHGGCFAMSLAGELTGAGTPPTRIDVSCRTVLDEVDGQGHQIVGSHLSVRATVPGIEADAFAELVATADEGCPFSALVKRAGGTVEVESELLDS
jgi:osmotically inducible protein OsmC